MYSLIELLTLLLSIPFPFFPQILSTTSKSFSTTISVSSFGAIGDGVQYDTVAIQSAINSCPPSSSPCIITFPSNFTFLTATIHLNRSNLILQINPGATLLGGSRLIDYHPLDSDLWYVVLAENVSNVTIQGGGVISGNGAEFVQEFREEKNVMVSWNSSGACFGDECRPRLVGFLNCTHSTARDITLIDSAYWCLNIVRCRDTVVQNVSIFGNFNSPNTDGIDIEGSNNTSIDSCRIDTGDDAVCPKTLTAGLVNLTVTNSWIRTKSCAVKFGSASRFDFRNCYFKNITIVESHRGLGIQIRDGGNVENVTFEEINIETRYYDPSWWGRGEPIYVTTCSRAENGTVGEISNVRFVNVTGRSENGVMLSGREGRGLRGIKMVNVGLKYGRVSGYEGGMVDYRPGCEGLVKGVGGGVILENVDGVEFVNVSEEWGKGGDPGWGVPLAFKGPVNNLSFNGFRSILLHNMDDMLVTKMHS